MIFIVSIREGAATPAKTDRYRTVELDIPEQWHDASQAYANEKFTTENNFVVLCVPGEGYEDMTRSVKGRQRLTSA